MSEITYNFDGKECNKEEFKETFIKACRETLSKDSNIMGFVLITNSRSLGKFKKLFKEFKNVEVTEDFSDEKS